MVGKMSTGLYLEVLKKSLSNCRTGGDYYYSLFFYFSFSPFFLLLIFFFFLTLFFFDRCEVTGARCFDFLFYPLILFIFYLP
jgi:hypothetical protein